MKYYDKIFFLVSLVVLGASCGYYVMNKPKIAESADKAEALLAKKAKGMEWKEVAVPRLEIKPIEWPEVRPQDEDGRWFFQVFTPPQIWVDEDGKFITESPLIKAMARQSFALKFGGISNEPYPIKYVGAMGSFENPLIQLRNESTKAFFNARLNQPVTMQVMGKNGTAETVDVGLVVKSFDRQRVKNADNTIAQVVKVVLFDKKLGKEITVYSNKPTVIEDSRRMTFLLPDGGQWHVKGAGESKEVANATYTVKSVDFDKGSAIVEMVPSDKDITPQTMTLSEAGVAPVKKSKR